MTVLTCCSNEGRFTEEKSFTCQEGLSVWNLIIQASPFAITGRKQGESVWKRGLLKFNDHMGWRGTERVIMFETQ